MKILFATTECVPFAKTGGLADVASALPKNLKNKGADIRIVMPFYKNIDEKKYKIKTLVQDLHVIIANRSYWFSVKETTDKSGVKVYFIENSMFFNRDGLYGTIEGEYSDNAERFIFFSKAVLELCKAINFQPDIIHSNDWPTGLLPALLKTVYKHDLFFFKTKSVFSIHNIAYQGIFPKKLFPLTGISWDEFTMDKIEYYDKFSFLKAGIVYSDAVVTVSKRYSEEIQTSLYGTGLYKTIRQKKDVLYGILNGLDYDIWNPETDKSIKSKYSFKKIGPKTKCKKDLQKITKLKIDKKIPVIAMVSRVDLQKGFDIFKESFEDIMALDVQIVLLGVGDKSYYKWFEKMNEKYKGKVCMRVEFDENFSHKVYAGSDIFLMPSKFEPCGLGQLIACAYGAVPIVTHVGGLADTVLQFDIKNQTGTGFILNDYSSNSLLEAIENSLSVYHHKRVWKKLVTNIMKLNFSWERSASKYITIYKNLINHQVKREEYAKKI